MPGEWRRSRTRPGAMRCVPRPAPRRARHRPRRPTRIDDGMRRLNRRTFLKVAGAEAGALALARRAAGAAPGPDIVVVGAGAFGGWTALHLREKGSAVTLLDAYG